MIRGTKAWRHARRTAIFIVGATVSVAGIVMLVLPGPGLLVIVGGLSILALEFAWAARLRDRARQRAVTAGRTAGAAADRFIRRRNAA